MSLISLDCSQFVSGGGRRSGHSGGWRQMYNLQVRHSLFISSGTFWLLKVLAKMLPSIYRQGAEEER